jgi:hypothetical protein
VNPNLTAMWPTTADLIAANRDAARRAASEGDRSRALADELTAESEHSGPAKGAVYHIAADRIRTAAQEDPK